MFADVYGAWTRRKDAIAPKLAVLNGPNDHNNGRNIRRLTGASVAPTSKLADAWTCKIWRRDDLQVRDTIKVHETGPVGS
jgi:hypothetical protein